MSICLTSITIFSPYHRRLPITFFLTDQPSSSELLTAIAPTQLARAQLGVPVEPVQALMVVQVPMAGLFGSLQDSFGLLRQVRGLLPLSCPCLLLGLQLQPHFR